MLVAGSSQRQIARTLNAAYASGLLSDDTFVQRTDRLLGGGVIDPAALIGDLNLRRAAGSRWEELRAGVGDLLSRLTGSADPRAGSHTTLLALDWSGAASDLTIGRHHGCDVVLSDLSVSRRHARLLFRDAKWILQDLGSTNGTHLNGSQVGRSELRPGDVLACGAQLIRID